MVADSWVGKRRPLAEEAPVLPVLEEVPGHMRDDKPLAVALKE